MTIAQLEGGVLVVVVAHGRFLSAYDILKGKWLPHREFTHEILHMFKHESSKVSKDKKKSKIQEIYALL